MSHVIDKTVSEDDLSNRLLTPLPDAMQARTNMLRFGDDLATVCSVMLHRTSGPFQVDMASHRVERLRGESSAAYFIRVHREIKKLLRKQLNLPANADIHYHLFSHSGRYYFLFLTKHPRQDPQQLLAYLRRSRVPMSKLLSALCALHLQRIMLSEIDKFFELPPFVHNAHLYLSLQIRGKPDKAGRDLLHCLSSELYVSDHGELAILLHRKAFRTQNTPPLSANDSEQNYLFSVAGQYAYEALDAREQKSHPFIEFNDNYQHTRNYYYHLLLDRLTTLFDEYRINFSPIDFQANFVIDQFLSNEMQRTQPLTVVEPIQCEASTDNLAALHEQILSILGPTEFVQLEDKATCDDLDPTHSYLFLNSSLKRNGSSIRYIEQSGREHLLNSFAQALPLYQKNKGQLDRYSRLKAERLSKQLPLVLQGLNLGSLSKADGSYRPINQHSLKRLGNELWLKERLFVERTFKDLDLPNAKLRMIYILHPRRQALHASVVDARISDGTLHVEAIKRIDNEFYLRSSNPILNTCAPEKLFDGGFYLIDRERETLLISYHSSRIPRIIGNSKFCNIKRMHEQDGKLRKLSKNDDENPLPYYVLPIQRGQYHHIFLQTTKPGDLLVFVSNLQKAHGKYEKESLIYNLLTYNSQGQPVPQLEQPLTLLYLRTFTVDILRNGESSKSSLLAKIARLPLEN